MVSFIKPTDNCRFQIIEAIHSVKEGIEFVFIVVDDGLTHGVVEWVPQSCANLNLTKICFIKNHLVQMLFNCGCRFLQQNQFDRTIELYLLPPRYSREAQNKAFQLSLCLLALILGQRADQ